MTPPSESAYRRNPSEYNLCPYCSGLKKRKANQCTDCRTKPRQTTQPMGENYRIIPLTQGQFAIVDTTDFERLNVYRWFARYDKRMCCFYARRNAKTDSGEKISVAMHREVLGLTAGDKRHGDHIDPNRTLDNRRSNLRIATAYQNTLNSRLNVNNRLGIKGVSRHGHGYQARIRIDGKLIYLGRTKTPEEAHELYKHAAAKHFGEFARFE